MHDSDARPRGDRAAARAVTVLRQRVHDARDDQRRQTREHAGERTTAQRTTAPAERAKRRSEHRRDQPRRARDPVQPDRENESTPAAITRPRSTLEDARRRS